MIVVDAAVLIAHLDGHDPRHGRAGRLLTDAGSEPLAASPLTLAEVLVAPAGAGRLDTALAALRRLTVEQVPLGDDAPSRLASLRAATGLKLPDCCVLLAAETVDAAIATFDTRLAAAARDLARDVLD